MIENIDVLLMQEIELEASFDSNMLRFKGYDLEIEKNSVKSRVGMYVKREIQYIRRADLEGVDSHIIVIDITNQKKVHTD